MKQRKSGILMHISSLPGRYGIGTLGKEARNFAKVIKAAGFTYWQILPLGPTAEYHSPYQCFSAFAGNVFLIDPQELAAEGYLKAGELQGCQYPGEPYEVDFDWLTAEKETLLKMAYNRMQAHQRKELEAFIQKESSWLPDYAVYMAIRGKEQQRPWWEWEPALRRHAEEAVQCQRELLAKEIEFECFCQYLFFKQWEALKCYCNEIGVQIIGDMPIYVAKDSADTWTGETLFQIDGAHALKRVAGVPPDYFSQEGQLWGNPLYDWEQMKQDGYQWWLERVGQALRLFDGVRIDHFRGFSSYWSVAAESETAREGQWEEGPGMDVFEKIQAVYPEAFIIAEDLGEITQEVKALVEATGYPGMRVMQFGFLEEEDSLHRPHNYGANTVAYTGTHDNNTVLGWLWEAEPAQRERALHYCGFSGKNWGEGGADSLVCRAWIRMLLASHARLAILPIQDICGFGGDTRMNRPGIAEGNWAFRLTYEALEKINVAEFYKMNQSYGRL